MTEKPLSPAMISALQAVARMRGDSTIVWLAGSAQDERDDRFASDDEPDPQQGWTPAGR